MIRPQAVVAATVLAFGIVCDSQVADLQVP